MLVAVAAIRLLFPCDAAMRHCHMTFPCDIPMRRGAGAVAPEVKSPFDSYVEWKAASRQLCISTSSHNTCKKSAPKHV